VHTSTLLGGCVPSPAMAPPTLCISMAHRTSDASDSDADDVNGVLVMDLVTTLAIFPVSSSPSARLPPPPPPPPSPPPLPIPPALPLEMASPTLLCHLFPYLYVGSEETPPLHPLPPAHQAHPVAWCSTPRSPSRALEVTGHDLFTLSHRSLPTSESMPQSTSLAHRVLVNAALEPGWTYVTNRKGCSSRVVPYCPWW
jgi:hypothetical protein